MEKEKIQIDPLNVAFARAMELTTYVGLAIMVIFGVLYLFNLPAFVDMKQAVSNWHLPVTKFWEEVKGTKVHGYKWFLTNLSAMDCLSQLGICILALAPFVGLIGAFFKSSQKAYKIFFIIMIFEFLFAILKPIIMPGVGGH